MLQVNIIISHVDKNKSHVVINKPHFDISKSHVNKIFILRVGSNVYQLYDAYILSKLKYSIKDSKYFLEELFPSMGYWQELAIYIYCLHVFSH